MGIRLNRAAPNLIVLCVEKRQQNNFGGRFYHRYQQEAVLFSSAEDLQLKLDALFDAIGFPQPSTLERRFAGTSNTPNWKGRNAVQETEQMLEHKGSIATFVVHVQYRQNATWQGKIIWSDKKSECSFRSALEMIKLMDQALEESEQKGTQSDASEQSESERTMEASSNE